MNKKNFASFVAGLAVMGVVWAGVSGVQYYQRQSSGRLGERYGAIEEKLDKIDKIIDRKSLTVTKYPTAARTIVDTTINL